MSGGCEDVCVMTHGRPGSGAQVQCRRVPEVVVVFAEAVTATARSRMCRPCAAYTQQQPGRVASVEPLDG
ncbi:hypothetical protein [Dactylosporangium sp. CS-033363]|uniref:hypothetical protein n=1 Tax=Dactylosporangium sp. CS-033363 TaxID=3239935 RepID=UPI003D8A1BDA